MLSYLLCSSVYAFLLTRHAHFVFIQLGLASHCCNAGWYGAPTGKFASALPQTPQFCRCAGQPPRGHAGRLDTHKPAHAAANQDIETFLDVNGFPQVLPVITWHPQASHLLPPAHHEKCPGTRREAFACCTALPAVCSREGDMQDTLCAAGGTVLVL